MARPRGFSRPARSRRKVFWAQGTGGTTRTQISSTTPAFVGSGVVATGTEITLVRTRGIFQALQIAATSDNDGATGAFGIGVCTAAAFAAGIGSVPTPIAEQDSDTWLYWNAWSVARITSTEADGVNAGPQMWREMIDSKAMRILGSEQVLYAAVEIGTETGAAVVDIVHDCRMLFKLP